MLRVLDAENMIVIEKVVDSGIETNKYLKESSHVKLRYKGEMSCMYVFYNQPSPLNVYTYACADSGYTCK